MGLKRLGLAGLLCGSLIGCSPKFEEMVYREEARTEKTGLENHAFNPSYPDSINIIRDFSSYPVYSFSVGLDLGGTVFGMDIENKKSMQSYYVSQQSHILRSVALPFGNGLRNSTLAGYIYTNGTVKQITFSGRIYTKDEFEILETNWKYGLGGGLKLALSSRRIMLADSTIANQLQEVNFYPSLSVFSEILFGKSRETGLKLMLDLDATYPGTIQMSIMFRSTIDNILRYADEAGGK